MARQKEYKLIGVSGSPRDRGTNYMIKTVLDATGYDYEIINLRNKNIKPCNACGACYKTFKCTVKDDMQDIRRKLGEADAIVLGSPTYFANVTGIMKNFIDKCLPLYLAEKLKNKRVALVTVGNFKKGELRYLDNYDPEKAMKGPEGRKKVSESMRRCMNFMKVFCGNHMKMKVIGNVIAINSDPKSVNNELVKLGQKLVS